MKHFYLFFLSGLLLAFASRAQTPAYLPVSGLVGWWPFTGNANDSSSMHNHGIVTGATLASDRFGIASRAYDFDGLDDFIDLGSAGLSGNPDSFSVSLWFQVDSLHRDVSSGYLHGPLLSKRHDDPYSWTTPVVDEDSMPGFKYDYPSYTFMAKAKKNVMDKKWHHLVVSKADTNYSIYLDGLFYETKHDAQAHIGCPGLNMHVGHEGAWDVFFDGRIDDIGIWNRKLTATEVKKLYDADPTSIGETGITIAISIAPNPVQDVLFIENPGQAQPYFLSDMAGKVLRSGQLNSGGSQLPIQDLAPGCYFLQIGTDRKQTMKIIKD